MKHKSLSQMNKEKSDRDRGTSSAVLRSSGPKHSAERPASKLGVSDGESIRRGVPANDMNKENEEKFYEMDRPRFEEHDEKDYIEHCRKFFKGEVE